MSITSQRAGGLAGIGFGLVVLTVNIILGSAGQPFAGAPKQEVLDFFATSEGAVRLGSAAAPLAWILLGVFAAGVAAAARSASVGRSEGRSDAWALVGLVGAAMQNCLFAIVVACQLVLANGELSTDVAWGVWELHNAVFLLNAVSLAVIMFSLSIAGLRAGLIRAWHGRLGLVAAAVMTTAAVTSPWAADGGALAMVGFAGFLMWLVWIVTYGVALVRRVETVTAPQSPVAITA
jgi:hypothetical protein